MSRIEPGVVHLLALGSSVVSVRPDDKEAVGYNAYLRVREDGTVHLVPLGADEVEE